MFSEIADDALAFSKAHKRSYRDDVRIVNRVKEWFGAREAQSLSSAEIERRLSDAARENKWCPSTHNHFRSTLSMIYREARRAGKVTVNPARTRGTNVRTTVVCDT